MCYKWLKNALEEEYVMQFIAMQKHIAIEKTITRNTKNQKAQKSVL